MYNIYKYIGGTGRKSIFLTRAKKRGLMNGMREYLKQLVLATKNFDILVLKVKEAEKLFLVAASSGSCC